MHSYISSTPWDYCALLHLTNPMRLLCTLTSHQPHETIMHSYISPTPWDYCALLHLTNPMRLLCTLTSHQPHETIIHSWISPTLWDYCALLNLINPMRLLFILESHQPHETIVHSFSWLNLCTIAITPHLRLYTRTTQQMGAQDNWRIGSHETTSPNGT